MSERPPHLRVTEPGEKPSEPSEPSEKPAPKNISAALSGSSRDVLDAMRVALAKQLDNGQIAGNSIASAYRELRELDRLIRTADAEAAAEEAKQRANNDGGRRSYDSTAI